MRRRSGVFGGVFLVLAAAGCGSAETSGSTGGAGGSGPEPECSLPEDCVVSIPECQSLSGCIEGKCSYENAPEGKALSTQGIGDCATLVCDGQGSTKLVPDEQDFPVDASQCTVHSCDGTTVVKSVLPSIPCYSGPQGTEGVGACKGGSMACNADGQPEGGCVGEVVPAAGACGDGTDADCDGLPDPACVCGDGIVSGAEECDDGNVSGADPCSSACMAQEILRVTSYGEHTCALLSGGIVKCWGAGGMGQLGLGTVGNNMGDQAGEMGASLPAVDFGAGKKAAFVSAGYGHTCAILDDGSVKCWGRNDNGQLGYGDTAFRGDGPGEMGDNLPVVDLGAGNKAVELSLGFDHTCALLESGDMKCWGANFFGQLGLGDTQHRGDGPGEMGDSLPVIDLGAGKKVVHLAAGGVHTCAVLQGGALKCWGNGASGQLGSGAQVVWGDGAGEMGDNLPVVDLGTGKAARGVAVGFQHSCAILETDTVKCWGNNFQGQLGYGDTVFRGDGAGEMGDALPAVDLGAGATAKQLTVGHTHSCALLGTGDVKCWGNNNLGQLGQGDVALRGDGAGEMGDALLPISLGNGLGAAAITGGGGHTCAVLSTGAMKCWGYNNQGALGIGNSLNRGDGPNEMGDALPTTKLFSDVW